MKMKKIAALLLAATMTVSLAACGGDKKQGTAVSYPGTRDENMVTVDLGAEPPELNSLLTTDVASGDILRMTMAGLTKLDKNDQPQSDLAESWEVSEDKTTYTLKLRQDAKWTNGEPVTANDFVYAWRLVCSQETASPYGFIIFDNLVNGNEVFSGELPPEELGVKALDDYTLEVKFENPIPYALHLFSFATFLPVNQKAYEEIGAAAYAKDADKIVTNGAYVIEDWLHDDHVTLAKNPDYYDADDMAIEKVKFLMMKDTNTRMNAFKAGEVDSINLSGEQIEQLKAEGVEIKSYVDNGNWFLQYNTESKGLNNAKIRRALGVAIDLNSLCENVRRDGSVPAGGVVPTGIAGADGQKFTDVRGNIIEYNVEEAKKLFNEGLAEEGLTADALKLTLIVDDTSAAQKEAAFYQEQWKTALGLQVEITPMPFKARLAAMQDGNFDIAFRGWSPDYNDPMTYLDMFTTTNGNNYGKYSSEKYDTLIADAMKETDPVKRQEMLVECEKILCNEDAPIFPLYYSTKPYVVSAKLKGATRTGFQEWDFQDGATIVK